MRAPAFWWEPPGLAARLLAPAASAYGAVATRRLRRAGAEVEAPIVCVGNVTVGGSGKTPAAIAVAAALRELSWWPALLTRGYGGVLAGPLSVDPARHAYPAIGDEAVLLARHAPTIVSRDRPAGAALAVSRGANVVVMDDGLQNRSLAKSFALAVFDAAVGIGNGRVLPAGPLRAPLEAQWPLVDAVLIVGEGAAGNEIARLAERRGAAVFWGAIKPEPEAAAALAGRRVLAFAGIGRPAKFFESLRRLGANVAVTRTFADHHAFTRREVARLLDEAGHDGLIPVTTEKDLVRLTRFVDREPRISVIRSLPIDLMWADPDGLSRRLAAHLGPSGASPLPDGRGTG